MNLKDKLKPTGRRGVFYHEHPTRKHGIRKDRCFILRYTIQGKTRTETYGWLSGGITELDAERKIAEFRANAKEGSGPVSLAQEKELTELERQKEELERKRIEQEKLHRPTFSRLWELYSETLTKSRKTDRSNFERHLKPIHSKTPDEIVSLDIDRIRISMEKKGYAVQTVKHVLRLITRMVNYGLEQSPPLCKPLTFKMKFPKVDNTVTETLTPEEHARLLKAIYDDLDCDPWTGRAMLLALTTGMRRGELLRLQWSDVDLEFGFIELRETKSGKTHRIPLNAAAREVLEDTPRVSSDYVFPGREDKNGVRGKRHDFNRGSDRIRKSAQLPEGFRPFHGLRHHFATTLANSGQCTLYHLQRLLTHADPKTTQRYAHLADKGLKDASEIAVDLIGRKYKVESLDDHRKKTEGEG